jgi:hypothetical protein
MTRLAALVAALVLAAPLVASDAAGSGSGAAGALPLQASVPTAWTFGACPAGTGAEECSTSAGEAAIRGVGPVAVTGSLELFDLTAGTNCARWEYAVAVVRAGRGELDLAARSPGCVSPASSSAALVFTVTGGTGAYAGATGSGTVDVATTTYLTGGRGHDAYSGSVAVAGLAFDLAPPAIAGARSRTVRVGRKARTAVVRYAVTARDAVDGPVPVRCRPRSGSPFGPGRTRVRCTATDSSANTASAAFVVTVRR